MEDHSDSFQTAQALRKEPDEEPWYEQAGKPDLGAKIKSSLLQTNDQGVLILYNWQEN